jgi:hypothetical protein
MVSLGDTFSQLGGQVASIITYAIISITAFLIVGIGVFIFIKVIRNKTFYTTPVTLEILNENGMIQKKLDNLKGGSFFNKGIKDFKVKIPKKWKPHILGFVPDFSLTNYVDGRLKFITSGDQTTWQQVHSFWVMEEEREVNGKVFKHNLVNKPIPRDTKQAAINSIKDWKETIDKTKLTAFGIAIGAFLIMVIAHLISLYIQTRITCGP